MPKRPNESSQMSRAEWEEAEAAADAVAASDAGSGVTTASPPPSADPEPSLLELLEPCKSKVNSYFRLKNVHGGCDGVPGVATVQASSVHRPVMQLLSLAVLLDATVLAMMVEQSWIPSSSSWIMNSSSRKPTCIAKLEFDVEVGVVFGQSAQLDRTLTQLFISEPSAAPAVDDDDEGLDAVREALLRRVAATGKTQQLLQLRVPVTLQVSCLHDESVSHDDLPPQWRETDPYFCGRLPTSDQVVQLFEDVVASGQRVIQVQRCSSLAPWVQFPLTKLRLNLNECLPLTPEVVRAARVLSQNSFVTVLRAKLDPRSIFCSADELTSYLRALGRHSTNLAIAVGYLTFRYVVPYADANGEDGREAIDCIMTALANCTEVRSIDLSGLLSMLSQPHNRLHCWRSLLEILLAPTPTNSDGSSTRHAELCLRIDTKLKEQDAALIQQIPGLATRCRRGIKRLTLNGDEEASTLAVLSLVRDMECLDMGGVWTVFSAATLPAVLKLSPKLRKIQLINAHTPSLEVFIDPTLSASGKCLEEISLVLASEIPPSSIAAFLTQLLDASTPLATSLRSLSITGCGYEATVIDETNAKLLERVLSVNRRLQYVNLPIQIPPRPA